MLSLSEAGNGEGQLRLRVTKCKKDDLFENVQPAMGEPSAAEERMSSSSSSSAP